MPLVEDTPNYVQQSVLTSVRGERPIAEDLVANVIRGLGSSLARYYRYGRDSYHYGLPEGSNNRADVVPFTVAAVIKEEKGIRDITIDYSIYGSPEADYFSEDHLENIRNWDRVTGLVSNPPTPVPEPVYLDTTEFLSGSQIEIRYRVETVPETYQTETISITPIDLNGDYYHVSYFELSNDGLVIDIRKWWFYREQDGTYPTLDYFPTETTPYMPVVPLRHNNVDFTVDDASDRYRTSKKLLNKLNVDITSLGSGINQNPDIGDIDHVYVIMGISTQTTSLAAKKYLFDFFKQQEANSRFKSSDFTRWESLTDEEREQRTPPMNRITIKEADISYNVEIGYLYITSELKTGTIGNRHFVDTSTTLLSAESKNSFTFEKSYLTIRKQIGNSTYEELQVHGLKHINRVYGSHTVDTTLKDAVDSAADPDEFKDGMLIPLSFEIFNSMSLTDRTELAYDSIRIMFNCVTVQKLKWYQTSFFKFAAIVVSIAITIFSLGSLSASLAWAASLVGSTSVIIGAVVLGVISIGVKYGVAYLVDVLGIESALILTVISAILTFTGTSYIDPQWLAVVQTGFSAGTQLAMDWEMQDILNQYDALQREIEESTRELDEISEGLDTGSLVDPFAIANSNSGLARPDETPEQYYNTRIHFGNMASVAPLAIENFVGDKLTLEGLTIHYGLRS